MEKYEYYLIGKEFGLETDQKSLEELMSKVEFETARIQRWISKLERFNFKTKYIKGEDLITADAMSRSITDPELGDEEKILEVHEEFGHRKNKRNKLREREIIATNNKLKKITSKCLPCLKFDKQYKKSFKIVLTNFRGEIMAVDLMDINKK